MPGRPADLPVVDHHCHLSPTGEGIGAARRFRDAGGTHLFLTTQNYTGAPISSLAGYRAQYETTEQLAHRIESELGVRVYPVIAPYPVDLVAQVEKLGAPAAIGLQSEALELAGRWVEDQRAVALGEVGRPHFPVPAGLSEPVDTVLRKALEVARDVGCPAVLHTEELSADGFRELVGVAASVAFPVGRLVKHYHREVLPAAEYLGMIPSYVARRETVARALTTPGPWFLETDFLDDPARPGAVLDLATVPRRVGADLSAHPEHLERWRIPFQTSVQQVYGFTPELGPDGKAR